MWKRVNVPRSGGGGDGGRVGRAGAPLERGARTYRRMELTLSRYGYGVWTPSPPSIDHNMVVWDANRRNEGPGDHTTRQMLLFGDFEQLLSGFQAISGDFE